MQVYSNELYHYGKIGMKWGHHKAKVEARKAERIKEDNNILDARKKSTHLMNQYNEKANYANSNMHDKKAQVDADEAFQKFIENASISNQKTHKEINRQRTANILFVIGALSLSSAGAYLGGK